MTKNRLKLQKQTAVAIHPTRESLAAFLRDIPDNEPVTMLNLLRYRDVALYASDNRYSDISGSEAFAIYARLMMPMLAAVGGEVVWLGKAASALIAPSGERWDEVVLVRYPDKEAFVSITTNDRYTEVAAHRTAALIDSRLIALITGQVQQAANHPTFNIKGHD